MRFIGGADAERSWLFEVFDMSSAIRFRTFDAVLVLGGNGDKQLDLQDAVILDGSGKEGGREGDFLQL